LYFCSTFIYSKFLTVSRSLTSHYSVFKELRLLPFHFRYSFIAVVRDGYTGFHPRCQLFFFSFHLKNTVRTPIYRNTGR
jgi:hypothetical protein